MAKMEIPSADFAPELVRGNLKAAMASAGATNPHSLWTVHPSHLRVIEGFNGRIRTPSYLEHLADVKNSIRENGYYQDKPLAGYVAKEDGDDVIYVTEGHTRFEAVRELIDEGHEIEKVPVVIKPNGTSMEDLTIALVTSNNGRPFTTYETALMVKRLIGMGLDEATIAKRLNFKSGKKYVDDLLTLAGAPKAIRDMVIADKIAATLAIQELTKHGAKATERLKAAVEKATAGGKKKASAKHLADKPKKAVPARREITMDTARLLKIGMACGVMVTTELMSFVSTVLDEAGIDFFVTEPTGNVESADKRQPELPGVEDPAAGL